MNAVEKMDAVNPSVRVRMGQDIRNALKESGDKMPPRERAFWEGLGFRDVVEQPAKWWNAVLLSEKQQADKEQGRHDISGAVCWW
jgi:hypothetical protein